MIFLKYVVIKLLGSSISGKFNCPLCKEPTLDILPPKPGTKDYIKCRNRQCDFDYGDVFDLLAEAFPRDTWAERQQREADYRHAYNQKYSKGSIAPTRPSSSQDHVDRGHQSLKRAYKSLARKYPDPKSLRVLVEACDIADTYGILLTDLASEVATHLLKTKTQGDCNATK